MSRILLDTEALPWRDFSDTYPADMMRCMRAKRFIGPGGTVHHSELLMGVLELDAGAEYPAHRHDAPEIYYVLQGTAECTFGEDVFMVHKGSLFETLPGEVHAFRNTGTEKFTAFAMWWAPGGDSAVLTCKPKLVDP